MLNRIIGILVLLAVGVLVYPFMIHSQDHFGSHMDGVRMPPFPSPQTQNETIRALTQDAQLKTGKDNTKLAKLSNAKQKKVASKHAKSTIKNIAWVIHVGTYNDKIKALSLVNQLQAKGYNAFIHQTNSAFGDAVQVYIGPESKRDAAVLLASKLTKETNLSGVIKTYKLLSA